MALCLSWGVVVGPSPLLLQLAPRSVHITSSRGLRDGIVAGLVVHVGVVREILHDTNDVIELLEGGLRFVVVMVLVVDT